MTIELKLPETGMGITEATIAQWCVAAGGAIAKGTVIVEVETAKAVEELEAPINGVLKEILCQEGDTVEVGTTLALLEEASE